MLISNLCTPGLMLNLIKKSWMVSKSHGIVNSPDLRDRDLELASFALEDGLNNVSHTVWANKYTLFFCRKKRKLKCQKDL